MNIGWVVPKPSKGSGGFRTITQCAKALSDSGHECTFFVIPDSESTLNCKSVSSDIKDWFSFECKNVLPATPIIEDMDCLFATSWNTAALVSLQNVKEKLYLVQDFEPWFYPMGDQFIEAAETYTLGLKTITIGRWLSSKINSLSHEPTLFFPFCANTQIYKPIEIERDRNSVCFVFQPEKPRRLSGLIRDTISILNTAKPELTIYVFGSQYADEALCGLDYVNLGLISTDECNELYNRCACGVCLSASNPSRIPFEMAAAGLPCIDINRENNTIDYPGECVSLAEPSPAGVASAVLQVIKNDSFLAKANRIGPEIMSALPLEMEAEEFRRCFSVFVDGKESDFVPAAKNSSAPAALPVLPSITHIQRITLLEKASGAIQASNLAPNGSVAVEGKIENPSSSTVSVAVWSKGDQSDIKWTEAPLQSDGSFSLEIPIAEELTGDTAFHIHCYRKSPHSMDPLFKTTQVFTQRSIENDATWSRELSNLFRINSSPKERKPNRTDGNTRKLSNFFARKRAAR